ncbi:hypothetical protein GMORB2_5041 [Geosmithia morbida]|uniref:Uncharacterized protein n=1 Tax=Geosmithia morbida TaxID=1094350 RepID=A0A9P4YYH4_9HYPO|nr:uncharacterized protein GMORB2_5041 [Geosmithia morbida]KAF4124375.1 hypothetical protein GMORB2_5041 [Geosmithia morbida]
MDSSNSGGGGGGDGQKKDLVYAESMRKRMSEMQQELMRERQALERLGKPYEAQAREQVTTALGGTGESVWMLLVGGMSKKGLIAQGTSLVASLAGVNQRPLERTQVEAVTEHLQSGATSTAAIELGVDATVLAAAMARWNNPPPQVKANRFSRYTWPVMLLIGYAIPAKLFVEPIILTLNARYRASRFRDDPRMAGLNVDIHSQLAKLTRIGWDATNGGHPQTNDDPSTDIVDEIDDDASPVAPSMRPRNGVRQDPRNEYDGSAWDRIRQQTMSQGRYQQQQQRLQQQKQQSDSWGNDSQANSYPSDETMSQDQAQRDFDRLLDQERKGSEQPNDKWR